MESVDPRGAATPLHVHVNEEETFYVLGGEVSVFVDGERLDVGPGGFALVPRGVPHGYVVDLGIPVVEGEKPPVETVLPVEEVVRAFAPYGCEIVGPPPSL